MSVHLNQCLAVHSVFLVGVFLIKAYHHLSQFSVFVMKEVIIMTLKDIFTISCTNIKVYIGDDVVYTPFSDKKVTPFLNRRVLWIDARDDILLVGISDK